IMLLVGHPYCSIISFNRIVFWSTIFFCLSHFPTKSWSFFHICFNSSLNLGCDKLAVYFCSDFCILILSSPHLLSECSNLNRRFLSHRAQSYIPAAMHF